MFFKCFVLYCFMILFVLEFSIYIFHLFNLLSDRVSKLRFSLFLAFSTAFVFAAALWAVNVASLFLLLLGSVYCCCSCSCSFNMLPTHGTSRRPAEATLCVILVVLPLLLGLLLLSPCNFIYLLIIEYLFSIYLPLFAHAACWQANAHPAPLPSYPA